MTETPRSHPGGTALLAGRRVSRIGYGAMQLGDLPGKPAPDREGGIAVLRRAVELGANHIDTAGFYGAGSVNSRIADALYPYADDLVLVSKVGAAHEGQGLVGAQRPEQLRTAVEADLGSLRVEQIPVVNMRRIDAGAGLRATGDQVVDLDDQLAELGALREEGKINAIGLSNISLEQLRGALALGIACVQNAYSLLDRSDEPMLDLCREHDIAWVPFFPLGSAFPQMPKVTDQPAVRQAAAALDVTPAQVGLAWLLAHAPNVLLIPGTSSVEHLQDNMDIAGVRLPAETTTDLDALGEQA